MVITEGKEHMGETFRAAYADVAFRERGLRKTKPSNENTAALQQYFKAKVAKQKLGAIIRPPRAQPPGVQVGGGGSSNDPAPAELRIVPWVPPAPAAQANATRDELAPRMLLIFLYDSFFPTFGPQSRQYALFTGRWFARRWRYSICVLLLIVLLPQLLGELLGMLLEAMAENLVIFLGATGSSFTSASLQGTARGLRNIRLWQTGVARDVAFRIWYRHDTRPATNTTPAQQFEHGGPPATPDLWAELSYAVWGVLLIVVGRLSVPGGTGGNGG